MTKTLLHSPSLDTAQTQKRKKGESSENGYISHLHTLSLNHQIPYVDGAKMELSLQLAGAATRTPHSRGTGGKAIGSLVH
jgi:hypothetical protein